MLSGQENSPKDYRHCLENNHLLDAISNSRFRSRVDNIMTEITHLEYHLFAMLSLGRRLSSISSRTKRLRDSFYAWVLHKMNAARHCQFPAYFKCFTFLHSMLLFYVGVCCCCCTWELLSNFIVHRTVIRRIDKNLINPSKSKYRKKRNFQHLILKLNRPLERSRISSCLFSWDRINHLASWFSKWSVNWRKR